MRRQHRDTKTQRKPAFQDSVEAGFLCVFVSLCLCVVRLYVTVLPKCCTKSLPAECSDQRQVIGSNFRELRAYQLGFLDMQRPLKIDVIQVQEWQQPGIASPFPDMQFEVQAFELI